MIFEEKQLPLKDGRAAVLKSPCAEDAEKLLNYIKKACGETDFLERYPEEWDNTTVEQEAWVNRLRITERRGDNLLCRKRSRRKLRISSSGIKTSHRHQSAWLFSRLLNLGMVPNVESSPQRKKRRKLSNSIRRGQRRAKRLYEKFGSKSSAANAFKLKTERTEANVISEMPAPGISRSVPKSLYHKSHPE